MPFTSVAADQISLVQNVITGDVTVPAFSRRAFLTGATSAGSLSNAPAGTFVSNLLTIAAPVRNNKLNSFAGLGLSIENTVFAGAAPEVAQRRTQKFTSASTSHLYVYPPNMTIGQLLVVAVATAALTTISTPGGWTLVASQAGTESRLSVYSRTITGVEGGEILSFGTSCAAIARTWLINIGEGPVEAVTGLNDSAAGTSLNLGAISPTWAVTEPALNLYIALLGLADDVVVSAFPTGYTATGQDTNTSGTANLDCALAYAEKSAAGSSEDPSAFTYAASRSTGMIIAIKPMVTGRMNWDGLTVRKNAGADVGTRRRVNFIEGTNVTLTVTDDGSEIDVTIAASGGGGSAHVIRDDGADMTQRAALNFVSTSTINAVCTDDAANGETEAAFNIIADSVSNTLLANMAALTVKANPTNASADPQDVAASSDDTVFRRTSTTLNWGQLTLAMAPNDLWTYAKIQNVSATARILGRITAGAGDIEELTGTQATTLLDVFTSALKGLAPASGGGTTNFLRADGTWAAPPGTGTVGHVIQDNGTNETQRANLNFASTTSIIAVVTDDGVNNRSTVTLERAAFTGDVTASQNSNALTIPNDTVTYAKIQNVVNNNRFLGRISGAGGDIEELTGTQATTLLDVFTSTLKGLAPASGGGTTNFLRADGTWAAPSGTGAGTGLQFVTYAAEATLTNERVTTASTSITINTTVAGQIAFERAALTGDVTAAANSNATTIAVNVVGNTELSDMAANTIKANATAATADPSDLAIAANSFPARVGGNLVSHPFATLAGNGMSYSAGVLTIGAGAGITVATTSVGLSTIANDTVLGNVSGATTTPSAVSLSGLFGAGLLWNVATHKVDVLTSGPSHLYTDAGAGVLRFRKSRNVDTWWDDFTFGQTLVTPGTTVTTSGTIANAQNTNWWMVASGASGSWSVAAGTSNHPGVWTLTTGAASGNNILMYNGVANTFGHSAILSQQIAMAEAIIRIPTVTTKFWAWGFSDSGNNQIIFYADTSAGVGSTTLIHTKTAEGGVVTDNNTGFTDTAGSWNVYTIMQETIGTIDFYIDDALTNSHSTNVPDAEPVSMIFQIQTRTAATRSMDIDYVMFETQSMGARTS